MKIQVDPLNQWPWTSTKDLIESAGLLHEWIIEREEGESMKDSLIANYPFYMGPMEGGTIDSNGVYRYPEDEPMYPAVRYEQDDEICYIYRYGIVATVNSNGDQWITRMD